MTRDVRSYGGLVVTPHVLSTSAGIVTLSAGGSAVDAALAANAVQGVVAPETCGIGGDLFALVWNEGEDRPDTLDASGTAGSNASADELRAEGHIEFPSRHPASITIPGCVAGWMALHDRHGRLPLARVLAPAIELATTGFPASNEFARATLALFETLDDHARGAQILGEGRSVPLGGRVQRPNLARTLSAIAERGRAAVYDGAAAEAISQATGNRVTVDDLANYAPEWIQPVHLDIFGMTGWTIPPSSQGYLTLGTLAIFEKISRTSRSEAELAHLLIEAYRALAWERNDVLADRNHAPHPWQHLLDDERLNHRAAEIDRHRAGAWPVPGRAPGGTAYLCVVDSEGTGVSLIQSNFHGLGTGIGAGATGMVLHNRGAGFDLREGHPNELAPGKRPLHTLAPTLWTRKGSLTAVLGTRGGHQQPQLLAQVAMAAFDLGDSPAGSQRRPRWTMTSFGPGTGSHIAVESTMPTGVVEGLERRGHTVSVQRSLVGGWGPVSMIAVNQDGLRIGAADPRVDTSAAAAI